MSGTDELKQQVDELQSQVIELGFAVAQLTDFVSKVDANYHSLTDQLVIKTIQKMKTDRPQ